MITGIIAGITAVFIYRLFEKLKNEGQE